MYFLTCVIQRIQKIKNFLLSKHKIAAKLKSYLEVVYMRFHFGYTFSFRSWSIPYNCFHDVPQNETHCGCYFMAVILTEIKFHFVLCMLHKHYLEMKSSEREHLRMRIFHKSKYSWLKFQNKVSENQSKQNFYYGETKLHFG